MPLPQQGPSMLDQAMGMLQQLGSIDQQSQANRSAQQQYNQSQQSFPYHLAYLQAQNQHMGAEDAYQNAMADRVRQMIQPDIAATQAQTQHNLAGAQSMNSASAREDSMNPLRIGLMGGELAKLTQGMQQSDAMQPFAQAQAGANVARTQGEVQNLSNQNELHPFAVGQAVQGVSHDALQNQLLSGQLSQQPITAQLGQVNLQQQQEALNHSRAMNPLDPALMQAQIGHLNAQAGAQNAVTDRSKTLLPGEVGLQNASTQHITSENQQLNMAGIEKLLAVQQQSGMLKDPAQREMMRQMALKALGMDSKTLPVDAEYKKLFDLGASVMNKSNDSSEPDSGLLHPSSLMDFYSKLFNANPAEQFPQLKPKFGPAPGDAPYQPRTPKANEAPLRNLFTPGM